VDNTLISSGRYVRFQYNEKKNGHLLRNMCSGMRGENAIELTYSGKLSDKEKKRKRGQGGCAAGYCEALGKPGLDSATSFHSQ